MSSSSYKKKRSFEQRKLEAENLRSIYPDKIPIIVEPIEGDGLPNLRRSKLSMDINQEFALLQMTVRNSLKLDNKSTLIFMIGKTIPSPTASMGKLYDQLKDEDGLLYVNYMQENTFG